MRHMRYVNEINKASVKILIQCWIWEWDTPPAYIQYFKLGQGVYILALLQTECV